VEQFSVQTLGGRLGYPYVDGELRKVARDACVEEFSTELTKDGKEQIAD